MLQNAPGYLFSLLGALLVALGTVIMTAAFFSVEITTATETIRVVLRSMVVGSLLTIAGYQVVSLGVFSTVANDPIQRPTDRITTYLVNNIILARGGIVGTFVFVIGSTYSV